jgi:cellulose biosynthesis protein BcsQ
VVIDTSPQIGWLNEAVILATDYVFIPTDCERFSAFEGVPYSIDHITAAMNALSERGLYGANLVGILPNKFRTTTVLHHEVLKELKERHGKLVLNPLPLRNDIAEMQAQGQFVFHRARSSVTPQMWGVVNHVERASAHV